MQHQTRIGKESLQFAQTRIHTHHRRHISAHVLTSPARTSACTVYHLMMLEGARGSMCIPIRRVTCMCKSTNSTHSPTHPALNLYCFHSDIPLEWSSVVKHLGRRNKKQEMVSQVGLIIIIIILYIECSWSL